MKGIHVSKRLSAKGKAVNRSLTPCKRYVYIAAKEN